MTEAESAPPSDSDPRTPLPSEWIVDEASELMDAPPSRTSLPAPSPPTSSEPFGASRNSEMSEPVTTDVIPTVPPPPPPPKKKTALVLGALALVAAVIWYALR